MIPTYSKKPKERLYAASKKAEPEPRSIKSWRESDELSENLGDYYFSSEDDDEDIFEKRYRFIEDDYDYDEI